MLHLSTDRLAALGDEQPTTAESAHLAACDACAHEWAAYRMLVAMAEAERAPLGMPLTRWETIASALDAESVVAGAPHRASRPASHFESRWPLRAAAALLLLASGALLGRATARTDAVSIAGAGRAPVTASAAHPIADSMFASVEDARAAQLRSEQLYQQAVAYLARYDSTALDDGSPVAYKSRLAALDRVISATSEAMREAPHDPVINGYYLTTLGQREATIQQLNTALPATLRLNSF